MPTPLPSDIVAFLRSLDTNFDAVFKERYVGGCASCQGSTPRVVFRDETNYKLGMRLKDLIANYQLS